MPKIWDVKQQKELMTYFKHLGNSDFPDETVKYFATDLK